eukprot:7050710-Alexandrium_andersonii.AAC.1
MADALAKKGTAVHGPACELADWVANATAQVADVVAKVHALQIEVVQAATALRKDPCARALATERKLVCLKLPVH